MIEDIHIISVDKYDILKNRIYEGNNGFLYEFEAIDNENIYLPFLLYVPINREGCKDLLVVCKTPYVSFGNLEEAIMEMKYNVRDGITYLSLGSYVSVLAGKYNNPVLIPLVPRCPGLDTFYMGYRMYHNDFTVPKRLFEVGFSKFNADDLEKFKNLDKQILNMINYSIKVMKKNGYTVDDKVIMQGYSASGKLANFFSWLHPSKVKMIISGGTDGLMMYPIKEYKNYKFDYPIGINDVDVDIDEFQKIKQFYFIAKNDINDPVRPKAKYLKDDNNKFLKDEHGNRIEMLDSHGNTIFDLDENNNYKFDDDNGSYTDYQVNAIINCFGLDTIKRFEFNEKIYKEHNIQCVCKKYEGDHFSIWKDKNLDKDIEDFYLKNK